MIELSRSKKLLAIAVLSLCLWEGIAVIVSGSGFPHIWVVTPDFVALISTGLFWRDLASTLYVSTLGFLIGALLALALGLLLGLSASVEKATRSTINFVRVIPSIVLLPLLIASIGASQRTAVILCSFVVTFTMMTYVIRGVADTEVQLRESAQVMNLSLINRIAFLYLPSMASMIGTGVRICASRAFGTVVAAGIVAGTPGIGSRLYFAQVNGEIDRVFSYVLVMGIVGTLIYSFFTRLENLTLKWRVSV